MMSHVSSSETGRVGKVSDSLRETVTIDSEDQKVLEKPLQGAKAATHLFSRVASGSASQRADIGFTDHRFEVAEADH